MVAPWPIHNPSPDTLLDSMQAELLQAMDQAALSVQHLRLCESVGVVQACGGAYGKGYDPKAWVPASRT